MRRPARAATRRRPLSPICRVWKRHEEPAGVWRRSRHQNPVHRHGRERRRDRPSAKRRRRDGASLARAVEKTRVPPILNSEDVKVGVGRPHAVGVVEDACGAVGAARCPGSACKPLALLGPVNFNSRALTQTSDTRGRVRGSRGSSRRAAARARCRSRSGRGRCRKKSGTRRRGRGSGRRAVPRPPGGRACALPKLERQKEPPRDERYETARMTTIAAVAL